MVSNAFRDEDEPRIGCEDCETGGIICLACWVEERGEAVTPQTKMIAKQFAEKLKTFFGRHRKA